MRRRTPTRRRAARAGDRPAGRSVSSWVATTSVAPRCEAASNSASSACLPGSSRPTNGSSTSSIWNGRTKASVIAAFWRRPRLNVVGMSSRRAVRPICSSRCFGVALPVVDAVQAGDVLEVLPQRQVVVERRRVAEPRQQRGGPPGCRRRCRPILTVPSVGSSRPAAIFIIVVLPLPLWPTRATLAPTSIIERQRFERRPVAVGLGQLTSRQFGHAVVLRCGLL